MLSGLIGKKLGMTQIGDAASRVQAVTVIALGPCVVTQIKTAPTDGYEAVQVTWGKKKPSRVTGALRGHFQKAEIAPGVATREFKRRGDGELKLGQVVNVADVFKPGDMIDVSGISKGHGFAGVIKRHHFAGFPMARGTHEYFRHGGSIGNRSYPGRVRKGLRMAGQMGNAPATIVNLRIIEVLPEENAVAVTGAVPGPDGGLLTVRHATRARRVLEAQANG